MLKNQISGRTPKITVKASATAVFDQINDL